MSNRLARESSPYLRQHADNPVDWHPWDEEALELAAETDRPILLSIGYSACHWCHVMERESFSDPEVAKLMNEGFVNIKVDREERPDVDAIYMRAVQSLTGRGGWPLTVFLTPDGRPFYGGTYFPPEPRHGMPSFRQLLEATLSAWRERRDDVESSASEITRLLERTSREEPGGDPDSDEEPAAVDETLPARAAQGLLRHLDPTHGGFGRAPKFPQPAVLEFLLAHHAATGEPGALEAAAHTLRSMARGGIRDHLGGGFHRYSVDRRWLVPHFEKMLYDNALLAPAYFRAYQLTGEADLLEVAVETLDYLLADMRTPDGAFYAARDADSEGEEGAYYVWDRQEVDDALDPEDARIFRLCYDVSSAGNFEGKNILNLPHDLAGVARNEEMSPGELSELLARCRARLLEVRDERVPPQRDSKVLAGWNGLALRAFAEVGAALIGLDDHEEAGERYLQAAREGTAFLLTALRPDGRLLHQLPAEGDRHIPAFLDDVAALGLACLSLHEATLEARWLEEGVALAREVEERFRDETSGLLFDTPDDGEALVVRPREVMDNAVPSGNSLAAELFVRVGRLLGRPEREEAARALVQARTRGLLQMPTGFGRLLTVARILTLPPVGIALVDGDGLDALLARAHRLFLPGRVITGRLEGEDPPFATPLLEGRDALEGRATAYACSNYACQAPVTTPEELDQALEGVVSGS